MRTRRGVRAVLLVAALASVVWPLRPAAAASTPNRHQLAGAETGVLVLVRQLTWDQAAAVAGRHGSAVTAGLVSTLPAGAPLEDRVLSLAAGREVHADGLRINEEAPDGVDAAAADRLRAANPDADFGGLRRTRVLAEPGMAAAGLLALGAGGGAPPAAVLPSSGPLLTVPGQLLVVAVADAWGLGRVLGRLESPGGGRPRVLVVGLAPPPGRARTAPLLEFLGSGLPGGVATSDSTRRDGLVAYQDVRPTLTGSASGTQGAAIRSLPNADPLGFVGHLDRQVAALVEARGPAVVLYATLGTVAMAVCLAALLLALPRARRPAWAAGGAGALHPAARALVVASLATPTGYLLASAVAPASGTAWLLLGVAASAALAVGAWALDRRSAGGWRGWVAPALLGALLTALVVADLLLGGGALSRPLLGNSAFDGERFYGLGNGYFAHALAGIFLLVAFRPVRAQTAALLLVGLAVVDGLPSLGADVGGALTSMLSAAAAWLLLGRARPSAARVLWLAAAGVLAAAVVVVGVALVSGETTHGSRVAQDFGSDPGAALRTVGHQLSGNFGLLAANFWAWWGPLLVVCAGLFSLRPPAPLARVPDWVRRAVGAGAIGSALLILLNDTGVTAAAGSGLALVLTLAWSALEPARQPDPAGERLPA
jgi:hypothetical protein